MIHDGIGFMPLLVRDAKVRGLREDLENTQRSRAVRGPQEEELVEAVRSRVLSWLLGSEQELVIQLPAQRRQRRLLQLVLQDEFQLPSLGYDPFSIEMSAPPDDVAKGGGGFSGGGGDGASRPAAAAEGVSDGTQTQAAAEAELSYAEGDGTESDSGDAGGFLRLRRLDQWRPGNLIASGQQLTPRQRIEVLVEQSGFSQVRSCGVTSGAPMRDAPRVAVSASITGAPHPGGRTDRLAAWHGRRHPLPN
jgi:hypothetical protein